MVGHGCSFLAPTEDENAHSLTKNDGLRLVSVAQPVARSRAQVCRETLVG